MITRITFAIQCASIAMALIIAHEYHDAKTANAAKLAAAIAQANDEAWDLAQNKDYQYAIYQEQVAPYTKAIPAATLKEIKARPR
jgi:hypothetical protein